MKKKKTKTKKQKKQCSNQPEVAVSLRIIGQYLHSERIFFCVAADLMSNDRDGRLRAVGV